MRELKIACASHRKALKWKNTTTAWPDLRDRLCATVYTAESQDEYWAMSKDERDAAKDKGCFVGGYLNKGRRKTENVGCRSLITRRISRLTAMQPFPGFSPPSLALTSLTRVPSRSTN